MPSPTEISRGRVTQVDVEIVRGAKATKWVTVFSLSGRRMFFVNKMDVNLLTGNKPVDFIEGDDIIVAGQRSDLSLYVPHDRPANGYYQATVIRVIRTGKILGSNGKALTLFGCLALIVSGGLLAGTVSAGLTAVQTHLMLIYWSAGLFTVGILSTKRALQVRANWTAVETAIAAKSSNGLT